MIAIKGMEIQTDCKKCPFMATDGTDELRSPMMCVALWATKHEIKHCVEGRTLDDCPLVEIVTCKDCKHWDKEEEYCKLEDDKTYTGADFYCADGTRRK